MSFWFPSYIAFEDVLSTVNHSQTLLWSKGRHSLSQLKLSRTLITSVFVEVNVNESVSIVSDLT